MDAIEVTVDAKKEAHDAGKKDPVITAKGTLQVAFPGATVLVDGKQLGDSPGTWPVLIGRHKVKFSNSAADYHNKSVSVTIKDGSTTVVKLVDGKFQVQP